MRKVSEEELEFILHDLNRQGIVNEDLRYNLLDHLCCIIENEMENSDDFYRFYESVLPRFFRSEMVEIQQETDKLLTFKNFYSMQRTLKITGALTALFTVVGAVFKTLHLPGAGVMIITGAFLFSMVFMPLLIVLKFRDDERKIDKVVFSFGLMMGIFVFIGLVFKLMHWPGATVAMLSGVLLFTFVYVPVYFVTRVKRPELRFNTIVNSVLMFASGGLLFALFDLGYSNSSNDIIEYNNQVVHSNAEVLFSINGDFPLKSDELTTEFHEITRGINAELEVIVNEINQTQGTKSSLSQMKKLSEQMNNYNHFVKSHKLEGIGLLNGQRLKMKMNSRIKYELMITELTLIQQQLAVNENRYLSTIYFAQAE